MVIWIATGNRGKVQEFLVLFKKYLLKNHQLKFSKDIEGYVSPEETGVTFEENAFIKAEALKKLKAKEWVLGEGQWHRGGGFEGVAGDLFCSLCRCWGDGGG